MKKYYTIGPLVISLFGEHKKFKEFSKYFQGDILEDRSSNIDIEIKILDISKKDFEPKYYSSSIELTNDSFYKNESNFDYSVENLFENDKMTKLKIFPKNDTNIKKKIKNLINGVNLEEEFMNEIFSYKFFWSIFSLCLLKKEMIFVHGGAVSNSENNILFLGTGGCGKTSTSFKLLEGDYNYLFEDFGILDSKGNMYSCPKWMAIYQSDLKFGQSHLVKWFSNLSLKKRISWKLKVFLGGNPRKKVSPRKVLESKKIGVKSEIETIRFLVRSNCKKIKAKEINKKELVERTFSASFRELTPLYEIFSHPFAVSLDNKFPKFSEIEEKYKKIANQVFSNKKAILLEMPKKTSPNEIIELLRK
ncbi:hypothetical protein [uncultured Ilyobacter sp.]|uniref:hypothetical protein n=1 Tax=uncultured Ilyobacter sp. TaxID=544433 RepID=UPI0029F49A36|nr:hypothetical protein [uncultured Ilyobacter sp.]